MENKEEIWKDIEGYEGLYQVSNLGRVKSIFKIMKPQKSGPERNYYKVCLWRDKKPKQQHIHRLVAKAFPEICGMWFDGCEVDHLDTNTFNNTAANLRVCTAKENHNNPLTIEHRSKLMKNKPKEFWIIQNAHKKVKVRCIDSNEVFDSIKEAALYFDIKHSETITRCCKGKLKTTKGLHFEYVTP